MSYFWLPRFHFFTRKKEKKSSTCDSAWYFCSVIRVSLWHHWPSCVTYKFLKTNISIWMPMHIIIFRQNNEQTYKNSLRNISQANWNSCISIKKVLQLTILQLELLINKIELPFSPKKCLLTDQTQNKFSFVRAQHLDVAIIWEVLPAIWVWNDKTLREEHHESKYYLQECLKSFLVGTYSE